MNPTPSPFSDAFGDARKRAEGQADFQKKMAKEQIARGADEYIRLSGKASVLQRADGIKAAMHTYNDLCGGGVRLSVPSIEAMIVAVGMVPGMCGMELMSNPKFQDFQFSLQAIRRVLQTDAAEKASQAMPPADCPQPPANPPVV